MTEKEFLTLAYRLDQRIHSKQEQITALNDLATSCTASMTGMPHGVNSGGSRMADAVSRIVDLQNEIVADMEALVALKSEIISSINAVPNIEYRLILEKRYINGQPWPEIADDLGYKMRYLYKLHDRAVAQIIVPEKYASVQ